MSNKIHSKEAVTSQTQTKTKTKSKNLGSETKPPIQSKPASSHSMKISDEDLIESSECKEKVEKVDKVGEIIEEENNNSQFLKSCDLLLDKITKNYKEQRDDLRQLMKQHRQEMKNVKKGSKKKKSTKKTGFTKPELVPEGLAKLVGLEVGTEMPRTELTKEVYAIFKDRNLFYENDKRVLRADKEIKRVFDLPDNVNDSTDPKDENGLNFYNIQTYIAKCYKNENKKVANQANPNMQKSC